MCAFLIKAMAWGQQQGNESNSINYNWLILNTIKRMIDAEASNNIDEFYILTKHALQLTLRALDRETRARIQLDIENLTEKIKQITKDPNLNEKSKENLIRALKYSFAESKTFYIYSALPHLDVYKITKDGLLDFDKREFEVITKIIRSDRGIEETLGAVGLVKKE